MKLTNNQEKAIGAIDHNLQIVACAGSGKTEVITRRIVNILQSKPDVAPRNIVAFTFTEKAAESLKSRIAAALAQSEYSYAVDGMYIGTIHGFCSMLLRKYTSHFGGFKILDTVKTHLFLERYHKECGMSDLELAPHMFNIRLFCECISKMIDDHDNIAQWEPIHQAVFEKFRDCLCAHGYLDFAFLLHETVEQIKCNPVVQSYLSSIAYLVVDEYQDVDDLQEKLIHSFAQHGANICVVGDDDQTIYQFRGSNAGNMIAFDQKYANVIQLKLEENFRSTRDIVELADHVIRNNHKRLEKKMYSCIEPIGAASVKAEKHFSPEDQYHAIARQITYLYQEGVPYQQMAILVRKGKFINPICETLERFGISYRTDSADYFFSGPYWKRFIQTLEILVDVDKAKLYDCWRTYIDDAHINSGFRYLRQIAGSGGNAHDLPLSSVIRVFLEKTDFLNEDSSDFQARNDNLCGFTTILNDYDEVFHDWQMSARIDGLLKFLQYRAIDEYRYHNFKAKDPSEDAVQIMTVHKSKGLEFSAVFLPNLMRGEFPASNQGGKKYWHVLGDSFKRNALKYATDIESERKLFYVAVTRAKQNLFLHYDLSMKTLSPFVMEAAASSHIAINRDDLNTNAEISPAAEVLREKLILEIFARAASGANDAFQDLDTIQSAGAQELQAFAGQ